MLMISGCIKPLEVLFFLEKPFTCLDVRGFDGHLTRINLVKVQGPQEIFSLLFAQG